MNVRSCMMDDAVLVAQIWFFKGQAKSSMLTKTQKTTVVNGCSYA